MQKIAPIVLVLALGGTAAYFSLQPKPLPREEAKPPETPAAAVAAEAPVATTPADGKPAVKPWPQENSDIAPDPKAVFGHLPNGFRYLIYPNSEPPKRVSLRLHIQAGSLMEADDQQGLAHFLEHMMFNGSKHYKAGELVPIMQRLGIGFGAHVNAFTSFDETVYMLDLPELSDANLDLGFNVLRDFSDGALLAPEEIDKERGVILSEKISRESVAQRIQEKQFLELLPGSLIANRFPIGKEDVISKAPRERFADFYNRYYTPSRMTFVVVGDVDPQAMKQRIEQAFGSMQQPANAGKDPDLGPVRPAEGLETAVFTDKELSSTDLSLISVRKWNDLPDTKENRNALLPLHMANSMIDRRFERLSKKENSPISSGEASRQDIFNHLELGQVSVTVADDRWQEALPMLEQEFRRTIEHGFTAGELAEAKANLLNAYEQEIKTKDSRPSDQLATSLARGLNENEVFSTPETDLEIVKQGLESLTPETCHAAFRKFWLDAGMHLILTGKDAPENAKQELAAIFEESRGKPVEAPAATAAAKFAYTTFGAPGKVTTTQQVEDLGITQLVLSNNVRLNFKKTDFEKNTIRLFARIGAGRLTQPADKTGLDLFTTSVIEGSGFGKHSVDELRQILAGRNVSTTFGVGEDAFTLTGHTTPEDFLLELQLICATLTDPGYRDEALWQFRKSLPVLDQELKHTPAGPQAEMNAWLHGNDPRYGVPSTAKLATYTLDDARKWLAPELEKGYLELSIVGDFDEATILPALLETIGALPKRAATKPAYDEARKVKLPNAPAAKNFTYQSKIPQGIAMTLWRTDGVRHNLPEVRRLNVLADIYGDRLREEIREKLGASYSPNADASGSEALDRYGFVIGTSVAKPEDIDRLGAVMREQADELAREGATDDELERALKPVLANLEKSRRDNSYWLSTVLAQSQEDPQRLDLARNRDADYRSIKLKEINALAKKYLGSSNAINVGIKPAP
jgi:zinc protease